MDSVTCGMEKSVFVDRNHRQQLELYLLATVRRQVEREHGQERDAHARDYDVDRVEERFPPHRNVERNVQVGLVATGVELFVSEGKGGRRWDSLRGFSVTPARENNSDDIQPKML